MPTLLEKGNIINPGHESEIPLEFIMDFFKARVRGRGELKPAKNMSDRIMVLRAETGAGKSTTIPPELYIRFQDTVHVKGRIVACTQPTRLNTTEIPQDIMRIYKQFKMGEDLGFQTGPISNKVSKGVLYMTIETIVEQLKTMEEEDFMQRYSFIVIDEAHHRDLPTDVALSMVKALIKKNIHKENCPFLIVMSATLDVKAFSEYLETDTIIEIRGQPHHIDENFQEHDVEIISSKACELITEIHKNKEDMDLVVRDILVFVTGMAEISDLMLLLKPLEKVGLVAIPLYRDNFIRGTAEFWSIFEPIEKLGFERRVIISTSIAETGVTIPTVKYVIDSGWSRVSNFYPGFNALVTQPTNQSSAMQRKGRCGRKGPGVWYPLYTKKTFDNMKTLPYPDIIRGEATPALLDIFTKYGVSDKFDLLDTPSTDSILYSVEQMYTLGVIDLHEVTPLGVVMSSLRLKLPYAKMVISGFAFDVNLIDLITIATGLMNKRMVIADGKLYSENLGVKFLTEIPSKFKHHKLDSKYKNTKMAIADEFIEMLFLYNEFIHTSKPRKWCEDMGLSYSGFMDWILFRDELIFKMEEGGFKTNNAIPLLKSVEEMEFIETVRNIKRCIYEGFKLNIATWNNTLQSYVSYHKFQIKSWSPLLRGGNIPNTIIFDECIMLYSSRSGIYSNNVSSISVMDGWISSEIDTKSTSTMTTSKGGKMNNLWKFKQVNTIVPHKENPVLVVDDVDKLYEEELLRYSMVKGGYDIPQPPKKGGSKKVKILVF